ncbi:tetratricopeptide repeat protein [Stieleria sp. TO1_6]|uniref:tetratricopeptide repeat protein n=1 Tax=Stieleria tagensis TaxID=2956795 RepID=UPI00209AB940|nr:tetratricopeptide repeat protein [Stieleria tagensis]MCO8123867.1 tetratricopeptide repeat protein [Stieleria tagensis]
MSMRAKNHATRNPLSAPSKFPKQRSTTTAPSLPAALTRSASLIRKGDYQSAAKLLQSSGNGTSIRNTLGVCLMRLGRYDEALVVFRQFVLAAGNISERSDISNLCKRNFAMALLLNGSPSGALTVLAEMREPDQPVTVRIYETIQAWERSLSWLRRLDWKLNRIEPARCRIPIDFEPGEFDFECGEDVTGPPTVSVGNSGSPDNPVPVLQATFSQID